MDNAGQICGHCGSVNHDPLADYRQEDGILACNYAHWQIQLQAFNAEQDFRSAIERMTPPDVVADPRFAKWADGLTDLLSQSGLLDEPKGKN